MVEYNRRRADSPALPLEAPEAGPIVARGRAELTAWRSRHKRASSPALYADTWTAA
jgi:hypothetical protein